MKEAITIIPGDRINLVLPEKEKHLEKCLTWINDPLVNHYLLRGRFPTSRKEENDWFDKMNTTEKDIVFIIELKDGTPIGTIGLRGIDLLSRRSELGILIGEKGQWRNGYATEAESMLVNHAFNVVGLNKVFAFVFQGNKGSARALEKVGFKRDGVFRQHEYKHGKYHNLAVYSILKKEWENK